MCLFLFLFFQSIFSQLFRIGNIYSVFEFANFLLCSLHSTVDHGHWVFSFDYFSVLKFHFCFSLYFLFLCWDSFSAETFFVEINFFHFSSMFFLVSCRIFMMTALKSFIDSSNICVILVLIFVISFSHLSWNFFWFMVWSMILSENWLLGYYETLETKCLFC